MKLRHRSAASESTSRARVARHIPFIAAGALAAMAAFGIQNDANADKIVREGKPPLSGVEVLEVDMKAGEIRFKVPGVDGVQTMKRDGVSRIIIEREEAAAKPGEKPAEKPGGVAPKPPGENPAEKPGGVAPKPPAEKPADPKPEEVKIVDPADPAAFYKDVDDNLSDKKMDEGIAKMHAGLKKNKDLAKDPMFWFRLGAMYSFTGERHWGDTRNLTRVQQQDRVRGVACFNKGIAVDRKVVNSIMYGNPFLKWYAHAQDYCTDHMGYPQADLGVLDVQVQADGSLKFESPEVK